MLKINFSGFKELERELKNIERKAQKIEEQNSVQFGELFSKDFMKTYTQFSSIEEMFNKSGYTIQSEEDFAAIDENEWDEFIRTSTQFNFWSEMQESAAAEWAIKQIGF